MLSAAALAFRGGLLIKAFRSDLAHLQHDQQSSDVPCKLWLATDDGPKEACS